MDVAWSVSWPSIAGGVGIGVWVALVFSLLPLLAVRRVSPLAVLRRDYEGDAAPRRDLARIVAVLALAASLVALAVIQAGRLSFGLAFAAGVGVAVLALWLSAVLLVRGPAAILPAAPALPLPPGPRQPLPPGEPDADGRPRPRVRRLPAEHPPPRPAQPAPGAAGRPGRRPPQPRVLRRAARPAGGRHGPGERAGPAHRPGGAHRAHAHPVAEGPGRSRSCSRSRTRRSARSAGPSAGSTGAATGTRRRPRSASSKARGGGAGEWKGRADGSVVPIAVDEGLARELKVALGDEIVWDVQGVPVPSRVAVLRDVEWARFEPNFFVVFPEGPLDAAPQSYVLLSRVEEPESARAAAALGGGGAPERLDPRPRPGPARDRERPRQGGARDPLHGALQPRRGGGGAGRGGGREPLPAGPGGRPPAHARGPALAAAADPARGVRGARSPGRGRRHPALDRGRLGARALRLRRLLLAARARSCSRFCSRCSA